MKRVTVWVKERRKAAVAQNKLNQVVGGTTILMLLELLQSEIPKLQTPEERREVEGAPLPPPPSSPVLAGSGGRDLGDAERRERNAQREKAIMAETAADPHHGSSWWAPGGVTLRHRVKALLVHTA